MMRVIAIVGIDGSGKTTQAMLLAARLAAVGVPAWYWRNAAGRRWFGELAQRLGRRDAEDLLGRSGLLAVECVLRWLAIVRALLVCRLLRRTAVMDRYAYCQYVSSRVHGGRGERLARRMFGWLPAPDVTLHLVVPPREAQLRVEARGRDRETLEYLTAADTAYRSLPEAAAFVQVPADGDRDDVHRRIWSALDVTIGIAGITGAGGGATGAAGDLSGVSRDS